MASPSSSLSSTADRSTPPPSQLTHLAAASSFHEEHLQEPNQSPFRSLPQALSLHRVFHRKPPQTQPLTSLFTTKAHLTLLTLLIFSFSSLSSVKPYHSQTRSVKFDFSDGFYDFSDELPIELSASSTSWSSHTS